MSKPSQNHTVRGVRGLIVAGLALISAALIGPGCAQSSHQATFKSPDEAVQALVGALKPLNTKRLNEIFGPEAKDLTSSGDPVADQNGAEEFLAAYNKKHQLVDAPEGAKTLVIGEKDWPFPVPIVNDKGTWSFDTEAGKDEILNRRIGENELDAIQTCLAIVDAQREYAMRDPQGTGLHEYAQKAFSDSGKRNGLYWETKAGEPPSPLGPLAAEAYEEGYRRDTGPNPQRRPFHGYKYKLLNAQGQGAPGGEMDYIINGHMIAGFALVAWPATYENSGVMTFITNQEGVVYQKDLGEDTEKTAGVMTKFDPAGWAKADTDTKADAGK